MRTIFIVTLAVLGLGGAIWGQESPSDPKAPSKGGEAKASKKDGKKAGAPKDSKKEGGKKAEAPTGPLTIQQKSKTKNRLRQLLQKGNLEMLEKVVNNQLAIADPERDRELLSHVAFYRAGLYANSGKPPAEVMEWVNKAIDFGFLSVAGFEGLGLIPDAIKNSKEFKDRMARLLQEVEKLLWEDFEKEVRAGIKNPSPAPLPIPAESGLSGSKFDAGAFQGRPAAIVVTPTHHDGFTKELPHLEKLAAKHAGRVKTLVLFSQYDAGDKARVEQTEKYIAGLEKNAGVKLTIPAAVVDRAYTRPLDIPYFPANVFLNAEGKVVYRYPNGYISERHLDFILSELAASTPPPPAPPPAPPPTPAAEEKPKEPPAEKSEKPAEKPTEKPTEKPAEEPAKKPEEPKKAEEKAEPKPEAKPEEPKETPKTALHTFAPPPGTRTEYRFLFRSGPAEAEFVVKENGVVRTVTTKKQQEVYRITLFRPVAPSANRAVLVVDGDGTSMSSLRSPLEFLELGMRIRPASTVQIVSRSFLDSFFRPIIDSTVEGPPLEPGAIWNTGRTIPPGPESHLLSFLWISAKHSVESSRDIDGAFLLKSHNKGASHDVTHGFPLPRVGGSRELLFDRETLRPLSVVVQVEKKYKDHEDRAEPIWFAKVDEISHRSLSTEELAGLPSEIDVLRAAVGAAEREGKPTGTLDLLGFFVGKSPGAPEKGFEDLLKEYEHAHPSGILSATVGPLREFYDRRFARK